MVDELFSLTLFTQSRALLVSLDKHKGVPSTGP
jgi:hypothetical protein